MLPRLLEIVDLFYPASCAACGARAPEGLCPACRSALAARSSVERPPGLGSTVSGWEGLRAAGPYSGAIRDMVLGLKSGKSMYAGPLAALMVAAAGNNPAFVVPRAVVPVPSTRHKVARRGYNPASLLAGGVASLLKRPLLEALVMTRKTLDQDATPGHLRAGNVAGAFAVTRGMEIRGEVLLVDDVLTTGATAEACREALIEAGAWSVAVLVAARAELKHAARGNICKKSP
ncbi:MAG: double zinc ribbon domain-containing protein [Actinomycetota bacterium]